MTTPDRRAGFTLIELLVVLSILVFLMGLTAVYFSLNAQNTTSGADALSGWLLSARQMARRDGRPTGLRFIIDPTNLCRECQYVQQPDDFARGQYRGPRVLPTPDNTVAVMRLGVDILADPDAFPVQAGDYLEVNGGGVVRQIAGIAPVVVPQVAPFEYNMQLNPPFIGPTPMGGIVLDPFDPNTLVTPVPPLVPQTNYRIIAQPRPIRGEPNLRLPPGIAVDFNARAWNPGPTAAGLPLSNPPRRPLTPLIAEIVFSPSGAVVGSGTLGRSFLWVRYDNPRTLGDPPENTNVTDRFRGKPVLIAVQTRTGFIASHPATNGADPYLLARDGRNSGL